MLASVRAYLDDESAPFRDTLRYCLADYDVVLPSTEPLVHYGIVRLDLPLGVFAAQLFHAAGNSSPGDLPDETIAVVLGVADECELENVAITLASEGVPFVRIIENTAPYSGQLMALGVVPSSERPRCLKKLKLVKELVCK